jgi:transcription antitermination factor NusG
MKRVRLKTLQVYLRRTRRRKQKPVLSEWIVVKVKSRRERYAARNVTRQGHECFVPYIRHEGRSREEPLFPGFIFVRGPQWYYLKSTYGVLSPIMQGAEPARMPIAQMKELLKMTDKEGVITIEREKFVPGQEVTFKTGAWQGHWGVYIRAVSKDRVRVLLSLLGGKHELEFAHSEITAAQSKPGNGLKAGPGARSRDGASR